MKQHLLPNAQYDDPVIVTPDNTRLICYGLQRSGSSYVWQLACDALGGAGVIKTHNYLPASEITPTLCTYRDFRDCLVSAWRLAHPDWTSLQRPEMLRLCDGWINHCIVHLDHYKQHVPACMFLRYEEFIANPGVILHALQQVCAVDEQTWKQSLADHNMLRNSAISKDKSVEARTLAKSLLLVENHVHEGQVGTWRQFVNDRDAELLTQLLRPALERWGYAA